MTMPKLLLADADTLTAAWLTRCLHDQATVAVVTCVADALMAVCEDTYDAIVVGCRLHDGHGAELLQALTGVDHGAERVPPLLTVDHDAVLSAAGTRVYYALKRSMPPDDVQALLLSAIRDTAVCGSRTKTSLNSEVQARQMQRVLHMAHRLLALRDLASAEAACLLSMRELTGCERAYSWFYDAETGALWSETTDDPSREAGHGATHGLTGLCARTGTAMCLTHASTHAGYAASIDDPIGLGNEHLLIQPVIGSDGDVLAVFVAVRSAAQAPFSTPEQAALGTFAGQASPLLEQLGLQLEAEALLKPASDVTIFREEALEAYTTRHHHGDIIRVSPRWSDWAYWVIVAFVAVSVGFAAMANMARYSTGPAVVRVANRAAVTAHMSATVVAVEVTSGQRIQAGQRLARFYDAEQKATVELLDHEFATQLRLHMLEPSHPSAEQAVHALRMDLDRARAALEDRTVRARQAGIVSDIQVRPGQSVAPGDVLMSIIDDESDLYVEAFLPGDARPKLAPGMPLRLEVNGYRYAYQTLTIESVSTGVIGPSEARRFLGSQISDAVSITGPVVLVRARLSGRQFEADGHRYLYHDGMQATAEVQLRSQRLLEALVPGLERL